MDTDPDGAGMIISLSRFAALEIARDIVDVVENPTYVPGRSWRAIPDDLYQELKVLVEVVPKLTDKV